MVFPSQTAGAGGLWAHNVRVPATEGNHGREWQLDKPKYSSVSGRRFDVYTKAALSKRAEAAAVRKRGRDSLMESNGVEEVAGSG